MKILIIGKSKQAESFAQICQTSQFTEKIFVASDDYVADFTNIALSQADTLVERALFLQADLTIVLDKTLIEQGIADKFLKKRLNIICANKKWVNLAKSKLIAKKLTKHYSINVPELLTYPDKFPVVLKLDNLDNTEKVFAKTTQELIENKNRLLEKYPEDKVFIEEYLEGKEYNLLSLWDGKTLYHFPISDPLTEIQQECLNIYQTKMDFMFSDEKANFTGFVVSKLLWSRNNWYVLEYQMHLDDTIINTILKSYDNDLVYLLHAAIYQKLDEF